MALVKQLSSLRLAQRSVIFRSMSAEAATSKKFYDVPEGHVDSDLSQIACNIGLNRRRDLTLGAAGEIKLTVGGKPQRLADLFQGQKTIIFGVPDCGKVCSEQHVPGYLKEWEALRKEGISQILCVTVDDPTAAESWGKKVGADGTKVAVAADTNAALTRMLGMELGEPTATGPRSLRYAAVLENGIVLKLQVDKSPAEAKASSAASMVKLLKTMNA